MMVSGSYGKVITLNLGNIHGFSWKMAIRNFAWEFINSWRKIIFNVVTWNVIEENINCVLFIIGIEQSLVCVINSIFKKSWSVLVLMWKQSFELSNERSLHIACEVYSRKLGGTKKVLSVFENWTALNFLCSTKVPVLNCCPTWHVSDINGFVHFSFSLFSVCRINL